MQKRILLSANMRNPEFDSDSRRKGLDELARFASVDYYSGELTEDEADGVVGVIASSSHIHESFYEAAAGLRIISRWGVGYEKVNLEAAARHGVIVTIAPEHMVTVAEYTIAQWMATLKRVYTLNQLSHSGDFRLIRTYEAAETTLGLYGFGRIGQAVAERAKPLLGDRGRLLVYDVRPDVAELASQYGAEPVGDPIDLFRECDTVSLHVSGADTLVTYDLLCAMQPHATLINPSRGTLVDDVAVNRAIVEERLWYYVVDDPVDGPRAIHKGHPRIICTNHNAGMTDASAVRLDHRTYGQVTDALEGREPAHIINPDVLSHPRVRSYLGRG